MSRVATATTSRDHRCTALILTTVIEIRHTPNASGDRVPAQPAAGQQPPAAAAEKSFSGQLAKVDDKAKEITLKGTDNKEMMFTWDDKTQITGVDGPQGLTGKTGSNLKVSYREAAGRNLATKIEVAAAAK